MAVRNDFLAAETYDLLYASKDFRREAHAAHEIIQGRVSGASTLLDVGCGTGRHVEMFQQWYESEGLDVDPGLIAIAHERCPDVRFHIADMASFALPGRFDSIVSFGGALAYAGSRDDLRSVAATLVEHLKPGGVLVIEPWYSPETWPGWSVRADFIDEPDLKIARIGRATRDDDVVTLEYEYLLAKPERIDHFGRTTRIALLEPQEYLECFADLGLAAERVKTATTDFAVGQLRA